MPTVRPALTGLLGLALVAGCAEDPPTSAPEGGPEMAVGTSGYAVAPIAEINAQLEAAGAPYRLEKAELSLAATAPADMASVVFANDRTLRLPTMWVHGDPRRDDRTDILQYVFSLAAVANTDLGPANAEPAVDASFDTWAGQACMNAGISKRPYDGLFPSAILTLGGQPGDPLQADINTIGFLPGALFDAVLGAGASTNVLGVTFTFWWVNGVVPTDINGDGRLDTAFKEVWYNNNFVWTLSGDDAFFDVETVALHENGHALEMGHYGRVHASFPTNKPGKLHVSPRAVMNAFILGTLREPLGTDNASLCSNFSSWPQ